MVLVTGISVLDGLEPATMRRAPEIPDTDHAGGFGGHRALGL